MEPLKHKRCIPCEGGAEALTPEQIQKYATETADWVVAEDQKSISRTFTFADFQSALDFVNQVGEIAQEEWHHPDVRLAWGRVVITFSTHAVKGLTENDFIMAAKVDALTD